MTEFTEDFIQEAIDKAFERVHQTEQVVVCEACWDYLNTLYKQLVASPLARAAAENPTSNDAASYLNMSIKLLLAMKRLTVIADLMTEWQRSEELNSKNSHYLYQ